MLYYNRINISEGMDVNKTIEWKKKCDISHNWCFLEKGFKFTVDACNGCHDVLMMSMNLRDIAILHVHSAYYCCIITWISWSKAIKLMQNINFTGERGT